MIANAREQGIERVKNGVHSQREVFDCAARGKVYLEGIFWRGAGSFTMRGNDKPGDRMRGNREVDMTRELKTKRRAGRAIESERILERRCAADNAHRSGLTEEEFQRE